MDLPMMMDDVDRVVDPDAEGQREGEQVGRVDLESEEGEQADAPARADQEGGRRHQRLTALNRFVIT